MRQCAAVTTPVQRNTRSIILVFFLWLFVGLFFGLLLAYLWLAGTKVYISASKQANAMCLVALDSNMAASLDRIATNAAAYTLLFSQLVVGPCILGVSPSHCIPEQPHGASW